MRAVVMREQGPPSVLKLEDWPVPVPGPEEALVKVAAVGVSYHDIVERNGTYQRGVKLPMVMGYEVAGTVERVGSAVQSLKPGDRVCCKPFQSCGRCRLCRNGMETACRQRRAVTGGYAEYVVIAEEALVKIPPAIDFKVACMLGAATGVALNAVRDVAKVRVGETVLVTGASGGLGLPTIEIALASGATVLAHTRSEAKRAALASVQTRAARATSRSGSGVHCSRMTFTEGRPLGSSNGPISSCRTSSGTSRCARRCRSASASR